MLHVGMKHGHRRPQITADFFECPASLLRDRELIEQAMIDAARAAGAQILGHAFHTFPGGGVTGVVTLAESHLAIHTWPEDAYAAIDAFMCGRADSSQAIQLLKERLRPGRSTIRSHARGRTDRKSARTQSEHNRQGSTVSADAENTTARHGSDDRMSATMPALFAVTLVLAACSLIYELLLAQTLSALLGDTVLRYSITIGIYLGALGIGAMLCERSPERPVDRLVRVELLLSAIGGIAVPALYFLDALQRSEYYFGSEVIAGSVWVPLSFLLASHALIIAIGLLSGFEVPLLLSIGERIRPHSTNHVLGVDYLGALIGSVAFPLVLVRETGLLAAGFLTATCNIAACLVLVSWNRERRPVWAAGVAAVLGAVLIGGFLSSARIEQFFLRKFYYADAYSSLGAVVRSFPSLPRVERYRSSYQTIDIVKYTSPHQWVYSLLSKKDELDPDFPNDLRLFLNREFQVFSGGEEFYHEWFVHVPIQAIGRVPRRVLVLGAGDGLAVRELLGYAKIEEVVHVELDPEVLRLAKEHPALSKMNAIDPAETRLHVVQADAFHWLRTNPGEMFDAIYIDMPYPRDYNVAKVYSREFYSMAHAHLRPDGFLALDAPDGDCHYRDIPENLWHVYDNTLRAAGFPTVLPVMNTIDPGKPPLSSTVDAFAWGIAEKWRRTHSAAETPIAEARQWVEANIEAYLSSYQEFLLAFPVAREPNTSWMPVDVPLYALRPSYLSDAIVRDCERLVDPEAVNSIFRPTLPPLQLLPVPRA
jgi:spermidine synthase